MKSSQRYIENGAKVSIQKRKRHERMSYSNLKMAFEVVKGKTLHTHDSHDGFWSGLCKFFDEEQTKGAREKAIEHVLERLKLENDQHK